MFQDSFGGGVKMYVNICNSYNYVDFIFEIKKAFYFINKIHLFYLMSKRLLQIGLDCLFFTLKKWTQL